MRIKSDITIKTVMNTPVVMVMDKGGANKLIKLNETAKFLFERLATDASEEDLVDALMKEYDVDQKTAVDSVRGFVNDLKEKNILE